MRQMLNKLKTFVASFVLEILLPLIFSVILFGIIDFASLTTSTTIDLTSTFGKVRTNKSIFDLIASMQNVLSLISNFFIELIDCVRYLNAINFELIEIDSSLNSNGFIAKDYKEFGFNKANVTYLRI